jgi:hypothetical protein
MDAVNVEINRLKEELTNIEAKMDEYLKELSL